MLMQEQILLYLRDRAHPGTMGYVEFFQSLRIWCRSVWQMPQYAILILMSRSPTGRRVKRNGARWPAFQGAQER